MHQKLIRAGLAIILALAAGGFGYTAGGGQNGANPGIPAQTVSAPPPDSIRVIYSLDQKQNDKELISIINGATDHIYFAIYTFTLPNVADALIAAKERGIDVRGLVDSEQSGGSYGAPIAAKIRAAGIPLLTERHTSGNGIMHIKLLVTDRAYMFGSYNWTSSATTINDELVEIGTDPALRKIYEDVLLKLFDAYKGTSAAAGAAATISGGTYDYTDASAHVGEYASVRGKLINIHTSSSGTVFLDFCKNYKTCPFSAVIFADDAKKFGGLSSYNGKIVTLTGKISLYQNKAEIILKDTDQIRMN